LPVLRAILKVKRGGWSRKGNRISFVRIEPTNTGMASEILISELLKEL
jgi:hypothetical protein